MIGTFASLALTSAETISREPLGVMHSAWTPVWIRFSTICICFSTSISRSAACTWSVTPRRSAASCAPRRMSTKNGWFSVLSTNATVGLPLVVVVVVPRLQLVEKAATARISESAFFIVFAARLKGSRSFSHSRLTLLANVVRRLFAERPSGDPERVALRSFFSLWVALRSIFSLRSVFSLQHRVEQHGDDNHAADHDLLEKRRHAQQVEAVPEHAHDQRTDQGAPERAVAAHEARAADHRGGNGRSEE